ncbi:MAG TPA: GFA family protein, partial [Burkholderiaceae bacterium]|nr:GFA family protein [Burkholderiaceae bacterium]
YVKVAASGARRVQAFCPECGTPLFATAPENATQVIIRTGCVRQRGELKPVTGIWCRSALPWLATIPELPGSQEQQAFRHAVPPPQRSQPL